MLEGYRTVTQAVLGTLFTWGLTAAGAALVFVFSSRQKRILDGSLGFAAGPGTNMVEYLQQAKVSRPYPYVLTLGNDEQNTSQAFVIIAGQALEHDTLLQAINVCFKAFYVLDIKYPKQSENVWEFLQSVVYEIPGGESKLVRFLQTRILACT